MPSTAGCPASKRAAELLVYDHGQDKNDDETRFRVTITFDEQADKRAVEIMIPRPFGGRSHGTSCIQQR